jgi:hypothetical protein
MAEVRVNIRDIRARLAQLSRRELEENLYCVLLEKEVERAKRRNRSREYKEKIKSVRSATKGEIT